MRLRNLSRAVDFGDSGFSRYASTVRTHARVPWPGKGEPLPIRLSGRSTIPDLSRPALVQLRLRAVMGVSARAEVARLLLAEPSRLQSISELATGAAYGKGNVAATLDMLVMSGLVEATRVRNQLRHHLRRQQELVSLLGGIPPVFPDWAAIFRIVAGLLAARRFGDEPSIARAANVRSLLRSVEGDLRRLGLDDEMPRATGDALNDDFDRWACQLLRTWAAVDSVVDGQPDAVYTVHRLSTGDWLATLTEPGDRPRPVTLGGPEAERDGSDTVIADDSTGGPQLAHAMLAGAERRVGTDIGPYWGFDPTNQEVSRAFADERLWHMRPGQAATFTAEFLRRWLADRRARMAGPQSTAS